MKPNQSSLILLLLGFTFTILLALLNSAITRFGIFIYIPSILLFPMVVHLDRLRGSFVIFSLGIIMDTQLKMPLGFNSFSLMFFFLIAKDWFHSNEKDNASRPTFFVVLANAAMFTIWYIICTIKQKYFGIWGHKTFLWNLLISSLCLILISKWFFDISLILLSSKSTMGEKMKA